MPASIIALVAIAGFILLFVAAIKTALRQRRQQIERLQQAGFFEWKDPDKELLNRLSDLIQVGSRKTPIGTVLRRTSGFGELYTFLPQPNHSSGSMLVGRMSDLNLPRFRLMHRPPLSGTLGNWLVRAVTKVVGKDLAPVTFSSSAGMGEKYLAFSDNPAAFEKFALDHWADLLQAAPAGFGLAGDRDLLAFSFESRVDGAASRHPKVSSLVAQPARNQPLTNLSESTRLAEQFITAASRQVPAHSS